MAERSINLNLTAEEALRQQRSIHSALSDNEFRRMFIAVSEATMIMKSRHSILTVPGMGDVIQKQDMRIELCELALKLIQPAVPGEEPSK